MLILYNNKQGNESFALYVFLYFNDMVKVMKLLKVLVITLLGLCSLNSYGATLEATDTFYHFAKKCNAQGKTAYFLDDTGRWQGYSANQIYQEYKYMLDMSSFGSLSSDSAPSVSSNDVQLYLKNTRAKRLAAAKSHLMCK